MSSCKSILITGANGFVGVPLCRQALTLPTTQTIHGAVRSEPAAQKLPPGITPVYIQDLADLAHKPDLLSQLDVIVHLAARVHQLSDPTPEAYTTINTDATLTLAQAASQAGVKRFIYLSSIKVNGEGSFRRPAPSHYTYTENDLPQPLDPYGLSKWQAEQGLWEIAQETGLEVVIIRPPLVYGPQVKANFLKLLGLAQRGLPLPLGSVENARSLIFVDNLADALCACLTHPAAAGQTFLISDGEDLSTPELVRCLARAMKRPDVLLPVPAGVLLWAFSILGRRSMAERLLGSLTVDSSKIHTTLNWQPPYRVEQGLQTTAEWFLQQRGARSIKGGGASSIGGSGKGGTR
ncbi:NAD-dependent epimerase/dehydratase family protein [Lyngbya confervoides]|uniref:NAD-dependent epimerase/dehydratase family protein n=1 Tax=Lyngbya confervoides BDU141951 TaxID=1574623 RepID=A0ABD4T649_9CYAN|nr:NAD-dependent epimerase/dehydratase family protein [Lyngbya confervoides]MCM1984035.1 NAD-dependent epimerase/dehydratase family protein [Lyngbya confervoides BDU141951]